MRRYLDFYLTTMKIAILEQFQYPAANYFYMIGMMAEPVIYLVVWSTVARQEGGQVGGYTPGDFAAYYIIWTLVRNMNIVFTPYGWEWRIQRGTLAMELLRPLHPLNNDVAYFAGMKVVVIILWLPLAAFLTWFFHPTFYISALKVVVFFLAIWGAYLIRTMLLSLLGMITFWTTRVSAIFELYFAAELVLSGRLVPMSLMPPVVQQVAMYLPFQWAFAYPINTLAADLTPAQLFGGLAMQIFWILAGVLGVTIVWRFGIRRFSSVGN